MSKAAFIAPEAYYESFRIMGFSCYKAKDSEEATKLIKKLKKEGFHLIFTTEDLLSDGGYDAVVLPGIKKRDGKEALTKQIEKALGGSFSASFLDAK